MFYKILQLMLKFPALQNVRFLFYFFDKIVLLFIKKPKKETNIKKALIIFPLALGDAVMMLGSLEYFLKILHEDGYDTTLMCHKPYKVLFSNYLDDIIPVDFHSASSTIKGRIGFLKTCRKFFYDLIVDPTGCEECTPGVFAVNASEGIKKIGVLSVRQKKYQLPNFARKKIFDEIIYRNEPNVHRVRYYSEVLSIVSGKNIEKRLAKLIIGDSLELPSNYVLVFPSASMPIKRWPVENYVEISKRIYNKFALPIVVCGTGVDVEITEEFKSLLDDKIELCDFIGKTNVLSFIELIGKADLVLTNDTSVYHIAVATNRKTCCITGDYSLKMFIDYESEGLVDGNKVKAVTPKWECADCENNCKLVKGDTYPCVLANSIDHVWSEVCSLLM